MNTAPVRPAVLALVLILASLLLPGKAPGEMLGGESPKFKVAARVPIKAYPFDLRDVRLLDGPFRHAMELDRRYVLSLDPDRLLHDFRVNAGLPSSAEPLGGWEEPKCEVRGHFTGHYLSACALLFAATGDERLRENGRRVVAGLKECQEKLGSGYLSAYPEEFIDRVEALKPVWAPWYTLHKIFAGLLDMYLHSDDREALEVARKFADWAKARTDKLDDDRMEKMLGNEHGGMNEVLANLHSLTGEEKYLALARRFNHRSVIDPASKREDRLTGLHANTQIPKFVGTAREYELTGEEAFKTASEFFWDVVVNERSYVIGGHSDGEAFSPKERLSQALGPNTTETCNTYNMLKLTRHLFSWDPRAAYADYYERALYNHILSSQNPETGMMCYYVPLRSGSRKNYNSPLNDFWCCTGTGVENHAKYGGSIYFHDGGKGLYLSLFISSELDWKARGLKLRQETRFPDEASTRLTFTCRSPVELSLNIRHPYWAVEGLRISVNGKEEKIESRPSSWAVVTRTWKDGDSVEVTMPMTLRTEAFRDNPRRFAFLNGPLVLAAEVDGKAPFPWIVSEEGSVLASIVPVAGKPSTFTGSPEVFRAPGREEGARVTLEPFYKVHGDRRYVVYWDALTHAQWQAKEGERKAELAREKELEARTVDQVRPGDEESERDHQLKGERMGAGPFMDRMWRHAAEGWFSYQVKVLPGKPQKLRVTYWGSDAGNRVFDVLVDEVKVAIQKLENQHPDQFFDEVYPLPEDMTRGKEKVTVKFQAHPRNTAGGVFGLRVLKAGEK